MSDDHHPGTRVADFGQLAKLLHQIARFGARFHDDEVGGGRRLVERHRRRYAPHHHLEMGFGHTPILAGPLDRFGDTVGLAESLDGDPRKRTQGFHVPGIVRHYELFASVVVL